MTTTVWKFSTPVNDELNIDVQGRLVRWLHVAADGRTDLTLWAEVEPDRYELRTERLLVRGTGHPMDGTEGDHIGTVIAPPVVWHVFAPKGAEQ